MDERERTRRRNGETQFLFMKSLPVDIFASPHALTIRERLISCFYWQGGLWL
jgi:hypothetical protein